MHIVHSYNRFENATTILLKFKLVTTFVVRLAAFCNTDFNTNKMPLKCLNEIKMLICFSILLLDTKNWNSLEMWRCGGWGV